MLASVRVGPAVADPATGKRRRRRNWMIAAIAAVVISLPWIIIAGFRSFQRPHAPPPAPQADGWQLVHLDLDVQLKPSRKSFDTTGTARLRLSGPASTGALIFVSDSTRFTSVGAPEGVATSIDDEGKQTQLTFSSPQPTGTELEVQFTTHSRHDSGQVAVGKDMALASWTSGWYPRTADWTAFAPGTTRLSLPPGWTTLGPGELASSIAGGENQTDTWEADKAIGRSFIAAPFVVSEVVIDDQQITVCLLDRPDRATEYADMMARVLRSLEDNFGPYPFPQVALAEVPDNLVWWYGMGGPGFIMVRSSQLDPPSTFRPMLGHELSHIWWGQYVDPEIPSAQMIAEAMGQYGALAVVESFEGSQAAIDFLRFSREAYSPELCARGYFRILNDGNDQPLSEIGSDKIGNRLACSKGMWVYAMLRDKVGDARFRETIQALVGKYGGAERIGLQDLRDAFVAAAPNAGLDTFFAQWLDRAGAPVLEMEWQALGGGPPRAEVTIRQQGQPFDLDLQLLVVGDAGEKLHAVRLTKARETFHLESVGAPTDVRLDPGHRLLIWTPEYGKRPE